MIPKKSIRGSNFHISVLTKVFVSSDLQGCLLLFKHRHTPSQTPCDTHGVYMNTFVIVHDIIGTLETCPLVITDLSTKMGVTRYRVGEHIVSISYLGRGKRGK